MPDWLILTAAMLLTGAVAGVLAGLFGIGGGVVIVPALEAALGVVGVDPAIRMHIAVGTSLATIVPTSVSSARAHHRRGSIDIDVARRFAPYMVVGAVLGAWVASAVHSRVLAIVFAVVALVVAARMVLVPNVRPLAAGVPRAYWVGVVPTSIGLLSALMGIGGGVMSVTAFSLFGMKIHRAVGTAALLGLAISIPGALGFVVAGLGDPRAPAGSVGYVSAIGFLCIASATVLTAPLGAKLAHSFSERRLTLLFGLFLVFVSLRLLLQAIGG